MLAVHADWSLDARKRWQTRAKRRNTAWEITAPEPVGDIATWMARLRAEARGPVALGVDLPLGLPRGVNNLWTKGGLHYAPPLR